MMTGNRAEIFSANYAVVTTLTVVAQCELNSS